MTRPRFRAYPIKGPRSEAGAALLAFLLVLLVGGSYALLGDAKSLAQRAKLEESRKTTAALAEAKAALIGYAVSAKLTPPGSCATNASRCPRPGDLPCPDRNNDGYAENSPATGTPPSPCGSATGSNQASRLARLPWRTLGLSELRDGSGEQLWYALSTGFKERDRTVCGSSGCLNSDSRGTITVKAAGADTDADGDPDLQQTIHDGRNPDEWTPSGAIAVIFGPGEPLTGQNRTNACQAASTQACAQNYLDAGIGENNATFTDATDNGFIQGDIVRCTSGNCDPIVNDRLLAVTYQDLIPLLEKRVVGEVLACLRRYADPTTGSNGRYPWAANVADVSDGSYSDVIDNPFGRLPDPQFGNIQTGMQSEWLSGCQLLRTDVTPHSYAKWWVNWKELVFYAVADGHKSQASAPPADLCATTPDSCLIVNPEPSRKEVLVVVSGKRLPAIAPVPDPLAPPQPPPPAPYDQVRSPSPEKTAIRNYLEGDNAASDGPLPPPPPPLPPYRSFVSGPATGTFNDVVGYLPRR
jgi:hypothetical protein